MHYEELAERARYFKKDSKGVAAMCEIWEEVLQEGRAEGMEKGLAQGMALEQLSSIRTLMKNMGLTAEKAMEVLDVPIEKRKAYAAQL